jgi:hypothetical protein
MPAYRRWIGYFAYAFLGFLGFAGQSCVQSALTGSGVSASQVRDAQPFDSVRVDGAADVDVAISDRTEVVVTTDDNLLATIETSNDGKTLVIREREQVNPQRGVHVTLKTPSLHNVTVNGAGNVSIADVKEESLTLNLTGAGSFAAKGEVDKLNLTVSGAGQANLGDLAVQEASIDLSGSADATVNTTSTLDINITGAGNVSYKGSPRVTQHVLGAGSVSKLN